jgi:hypothetical protein
MTIEPIKAADSVEQHQENGRIITLETISPELRLFINKRCSRSELLRNEKIMSK